MLELYVQVPAEYADYYDQRILKRYQTILANFDSHPEGVRVLFRPSINQTKISYLILGSGSHEPDLEMLTLNFLVAIKTEDICRHHMCAYDVQVNAIFHIGDETIEASATSQPRCMSS